MIDNIEPKVQSFRMVGLTATPWRTAEKEKGLLKKVFPDDIIYTINLLELVKRGYYRNLYLKMLKLNSI